MTKFSKFILSSMVAIASMTVSAPLHSMENMVKTSRTSKPALLVYRGQTEPRYDNNREVELRVERIRRKAKACCVLWLYVPVGVGAFVAFQLSAQAIQYFLNN